MKKFEKKLHDELIAHIRNFFPTGIFFLTRNATKAFGQKTLFRERGTSNFFLERNSRVEIRNLKKKFWRQCKPTGSLTLGFLNFPTKFARIFLSFLPCSTGELLIPKVPATDGFRILLYPHVFSKAAYSLVLVHRVTIDQVVRWSSRWQKNVRKHKFLNNKYFVTPYLIC